MRYYLVSCLLLFLLFFVDSCSPEEIPQFNMDEVLEKYGEEWLNALCSNAFQGRRVGTDGNSQAFEYIKHEVSKMGFSSNSQVFEIEGGTIVRNLIVSIPGQSDSTIIIGAHFDGAVQSNSVEHYEAAEDNASGTVALLMSRLIKQSRSPIL